MVCAQRPDQFRRRGRVQGRAEISAQYLPGDVRQSDRPGIAIEINLSHQFRHRERAAAPDDSRRRGQARAGSTIAGSQGEVRRVEAARKINSSTQRPAHILAGNRKELSGDLGMVRPVFEVIVGQTVSLPGLPRKTYWWNPSKLMVCPSHRQRPIDGTGAKSTVCSGPGEVIFDGDQAN